MGGSVVNVGGCFSALGVGYMCDLESISDRSSPEKNRVRLGGSVGFRVMLGDCTGVSAPPGCAEVRAPPWIGAGVAGDDGSSF